LFLPFSLVWESGIIYPHPLLSLHSPALPSILFFFFCSCLWLPAPTPALFLANRFDCRRWTNIHRSRTTFFSFKKRPRFCFDSLLLFQANFVVFHSSHGFSLVILALHQFIRLSFLRQFHDNEQFTMTEIDIGNLQSPCPHFTTPLPLIASQHSVVSRS